ncbi:MAG: hypothetical protein JKP98_14215 [Rhodobacteraceae bacterium]|jgi:hypothetical protein|nr:hypothetical protein [Paracoccaceae bacterium]MBL4557830.1 hypothetical protein [Paracoccaceae bacterium]HBG98834.1 hypothetical protein [Paracoccaceae bacterium]
MKRTLTALAAIAALTTVAPAAFAFENALAELQNQVTNELADKGYPTEFVDQLTLGELTTIRSLLEGGQGAGVQIQRILERAAQR